MSRFIVIGSALVLAAGVSVARGARAEGPDDADVFVHINGAGKLVQDATTMCEAPCDTRVPAGAAYKIVDGDAESKPFILAGTRAFVSVRRVTHTHQAAGAAILGGTLAAVAGLFALGAAMQNQSCSGIICPNPSAFYTLAGFFGFSGATVGTVLLAIPDHTSLATRIDHVPRSAAMGSALTFHF